MHDAPAVGVLVRRADPQVAPPVARPRERIELVDHQVLIAAVAQGVALLDGVVPADHPLAAGARPELELPQLRAQRLGLVHLREKRMGAHLGVVGLRHPKGVDRLNGNVRALEELRGECVGGRPGESVALVEPVGLAELSYDAVAPADLPEHQLAHLADVLAQRRAGLPVHLGQAVEIELEGSGSPKLREVELIRAEDAVGDRLGVRAFLGFGQPVEEAAPGGVAHPVDVLDHPARPVRPLRELAREEIGPREEIGEMHLPVAGLLAVGRRDSPPRGSPGLLGEDGDPVVLLGEIEEPVGEVGDHRALVDQEALEDGVALPLQRGRLPQEFPRVGDDAAADRKVRDLSLDHPGGKQVQLDPRRRVAGIGAAVDLHDDRHGPGGVAKLLDNLGHQSTLSLVSEGNSDIGNELAGEGE